MNLAQIRQRTNDRLNQVVGEGYPATYLNRVINEAYYDVVNAMDESAVVRRAAGTTETLSVTSAAREYQMVYRARKIVDVTRVRDDGTEETVDIRPYSMRDRPQAGWYDDCYVYYGENDKWIVGLIDPQPRTQTLTVYSSGLVPELLEDGQDAVWVPKMHQGLIAVKAALMVLEDEDRELGALPSIYAEKMRRLMNSFGAVKSHTSRPW